MAGSRGGRGQGGLSHPQAEEGWCLTSPRQTPPPRVPTAGGPTEAPHLTVDDLAQRDQYPHAALFSKAKLSLCLSILFPEQSKQHPCTALVGLTHLTAPLHNLKLNSRPS